MYVFGDFTSRSFAHLPAFHVTQMMHPMSYALECLTLGGEYMDHNDFLDDNTLKVQFSKTKANFQLK